MQPELQDEAGWELMANRGFFCLDGYLNRTAKLTDEELGRLFRACMVYHATGEVTDLEGRESVAFDFIREDIDAANEAYAAKCETNRRNRIGTNGIETAQPMTIVDERPRPITTDDETAQYKIKSKDKYKNKNKEIEERFAQFWAAYPRKEAKSTALKAFQKIAPDDAMLQTMLTAIDRFKETEQWQEDGGKYIPHPTTWLNQRRWEDEPPKASTGYKKPRKDDYDQRPNELPDGNTVPQWLQNYRAKQEAQNA